MLAICHNKARERGLDVTIHLQAMEKLSLDRQFASIIVPSSSFQLVPDISSAESSLARFHRHLLPGGALVFSIWQIHPKLEGRWTDWWLVVERDGYRGSRSLRRWERSLYEPLSRLRHTESRYEVLDGERVVYVEEHRRSPEMRNYNPTEVVSMARDAGFVDVHAVSGFSMTPASEDDEVFCVVGKTSSVAA